MTALYHQYCHNNIDAHILTYAIWVFLVKDIQLVKYMLYLTNFVSIAKCSKIRYPIHEVTIHQINALWGILNLWPTSILLPPKRITRTWAHGKKRVGFFANNNTPVSAKWSSIREPRLPRTCSSDKFVHVSFLYLTRNSSPTSSNGNHTTTSHLMRQQTQ